MNRKCQVFTPKDYVKKLLDIVGYTNNLYGKKILENSCGNGNILIEIVQRYINDSRALNKSNVEIENGLENDIFGIEIDYVQYTECINNLNELLNKNGLKLINWNITNQDYLKWDIEKKFDFIVGNPPYINYTEIKKDELLYLKTNFKSCKKGKFDYCYAFIEKSITNLSENGKMSYLIPSSIFKTVFGFNLRELIKPFTKKIIDYSLKKIFNKALIKSAIIILDKTATMEEKIEYIEEHSKKNLYLLKEKLSNKWIFSEIKVGSYRFGDYFKVSHVVATLSNSIYILKEKDYIETFDFYIYKNKYKIEKKIVYETASPRSLRYKNVEKIIFPYTYINNKLIRYEENEFRDNFPGAFTYLNDNKSKLINRKSDKSAKWFEYGRSQALQNIYNEKLLISTIVSEKIRVYKLSEDCIPYAGVSIILKEKNNKFLLKKAKEILESKDFFEYILSIGIPINGNSVRITSKDIENYYFMEE